jgi:putative endonuclease
MTPIQRGGFIYIITNKTHGTVYIGVTNNLLRRIDKHRRGAGSAFAAKYNLTHLVYAERFSDIREAIAREKQLKRWRRAKKAWLIEQQNPHWHDLYADWFSGD